ncbi:MAG: NADH-quinone oxidoreductase subunit N [Candidatus Schekmanbacteria bacterium]|nr:NADH-quinone oxidoreductase subunit N [Candidatus Schekmanbacteria bacterium]
MDASTTIRADLLTLTSEQAMMLSPYLWVFGGTVLAMILSVTRAIQPRLPVFIVSVLTALVGMVVSLGLFAADRVMLFNNMMVGDSYANFFNVVFLASAALTMLASFEYLDQERLQYGEYYLLVLFAALGMMLMASALDLIVIFIALELMSLSVYVLVGFRRADRRSNEAAMKYFILGAAASAILLYGTALLYGATQSTNIRDIQAFVQSQSGGVSIMFTLGAWLVIVGFLFKIASVPFHMWMPDVYEGAPTPITGFMTTGLKAAAFATFVRIFISTGYGDGLPAAIQSHMHDIIVVCAVLTMVIGNAVALTQTNLKRMLAYSSIAHTGYILVGMIAGQGSEQGYAPVVLYLVAYAVMNMGAFAVLAILAARADQGLNLRDFSGLSSRQPWLAFAMSVFLLSMAGIPPTAGFAAKYLLFYSAVQAHEIGLVVISVLCSAISVYYYLRVLVHMYMHEPEEGAAPLRPVSVWAAAVVASMVVLTVQIGTLPAGMLAAAKRAVMSL